MVVTAPPLITTEPALSVVTLVNGADPPTIPPNVVAPAVFTVKPKAPLTVLAKLIAPLPLLARVVLAPKVTAPV